MSGTRLLIGYDGSKDADGAIRAAGRLLRGPRRWSSTAKLFPGRSAVVMQVWASPVRRSYVGSALLAIPMQEVSETAGDLDEMFAAEGAMSRTKVRRSLANTGSMPAVQPELIRGRFVA